MMMMMASLAEVCSDAPAPLSRRASTAEIVVGQAQEAQSDVDYPVAQADHYEIVQKVQASWVLLVVRVVLIVQQYCHST